MHNKKCHVPLSNQIMHIESVAQGPAHKRKKKCHMNQTKKVGKRPFYSPWRIMMGAGAGAGVGAGRSGPPGSMAATKT